MVRLSWSGCCGQAVVVRCGPSWSVMVRHGQVVVVRSSWSGCCGQVVMVGRQSAGPQRDHSISLSRGRDTGPQPNHSILLSHCRAGLMEACRGRDTGPQ